MAVIAPKVSLALLLPLSLCLVPLLSGAMAMSPVHGDLPIPPSMPGTTPGLAGPVLLSAVNTSFPITAMDEGRRLEATDPLFGQPDTDGDGMTDAAEDAVIRVANPLLVLDQDESVLAHPGHHVVNFMGVTPYPAGEDPDYIFVYSILTWTMDYGKYSVGTHHGDTEPLLMVWRLGDNRTMVLDSVFIHAHDGCSEHEDLWPASGIGCNTGGVCDFTGRRAGTETICSALEFSDDRLRVSVSRDKHALYPSAEACNSVTLVRPSTRWTWADPGGSCLNLLGSLIDGIPERLPFSGGSPGPFSIHEECGSPGAGRAGTELQAPPYNIGEPGRLSITDLAPYGFPGEGIGGTSCGNLTRFFGGLGCDGKGATPVLSWVSEIPPVVLARMALSRPGHSGLP